MTKRKFVSAAINRKKESANQVVDGFLFIYQETELTVLYRDNS